MMTGNLARPREGKVDPDLRRLYRHLAQCDVCQLRSWQDGRLCGDGNLLAQAWTPTKAVPKFLIGGVREVAPPAKVHSAGPADAGDHGDGPIGISQPTPTGGAEDASAGREHARRRASSLAGTLTWE